MELIQGAWEYYARNQASFWQATRQHLALSLAALAISILVCLPLGIWIARRTTIAQVVINFFNAFRVLPSLAILFLALPYLGLGFLPSLIALTVLAFPPVLINTYAGLRNVDAAVIEAAYGMGMDSRQVLRQVELPLAAPTILAGIRTTAVEVISSATLAAFIGGGGLGDFITRGFALYNVKIMLVGAIPIAFLALTSEGILGLFQRAFRYA
ncbi:MAG TPA: ABC transporter permease [Anaerolineaceae bacterium]|nr:ABC transporter permease [Anaerolineaceae bacterium]